ncbi:MAG: nucleoside recognition domain-containing protein [Clostridia bacterium]
MPKKITRKTASKNLPINKDDCEVASQLNTSPAQTLPPQMASQADQPSSNFDATNQEEVATANQVTNSTASQEEIATANPATNSTASQEEVATANPATNSTASQEEVATANQTSLYEEAITQAKHNEKPSNIVIHQTIVKTDTPQINVYKKVVSLEGFICLALIAGGVIAFGLIMGFTNSLNTMFNTAFHLLTNTVWYLLALIVLMGALSGILNEFGVTSIANKVFSPLMRPLYGMPGATSVAILTSFLSDNPAILTLGNDKNFARYFKKYQLAALTNIGTTFGMGLIVIVAMSSVKGEHFSLAILIGLLAVVLASIVTTRLMLFKTKRVFGKDQPAVEEDTSATVDLLKYREVRQGSVMSRLFSAMLDGGESGVKIGLGIIPGVLIIATLVLMLTNGCPEGGYSGAYGEGIGFITKVGQFLMPVLNPLFGFNSPEAIAVPLTSLGSAGAAVSLVPELAKSGMLTPNNIAVFTSMSMFWSGYLSTHVSMMDTLHFRNLVGWSIAFHTIGGLLAGILANWLFNLVALFL